MILLSLSSIVALNNGCLFTKTSAFYSASHSRQTSILFYLYLLNSICDMLDSQSPYCSFCVQQISLFLIPSFLSSIFKTSSKSWNSENVSLKMCVDVQNEFIFRKTIWFLLYSNFIVNHFIDYIFFTMDSSYGPSDINNRSNKSIYSIVMLFNSVMS